MSQLIEGQLPDTDYQLIEANQLGTPLMIYRLSSNFITFLRVLALFIIGCSIIMLALSIFVVFMHWNKESADNYIMFGMLMITTSFSLVMGLAIWNIALPGAKNKHIVVCEQGLLQIGKKIGSKQVEVIRWLDILAIKRFFHEYFIVYQDNKVCELEITYQGIKELVGLIKDEVEKRRITSIQS